MIRRYHGYRPGPHGEVVEARDDLVGHEARRVVDQRHGAETRGLRAGDVDLPCELLVERLVRQEQETQPVVRQFLADALRALARRAQADA